MARTEVTEDELFANVSRQLQVPEEVLRAFAKRENIAALELYREKVATMEWKRLHGGRQVIGGRIASVGGAVTPREVVTE